MSFLTGWTRADGLAYWSSQAGWLVELNAIWIPFAKNWGIAFVRRTKVSEEGVALD